MKIIDLWFKCTIIHFKNYMCTHYISTVHCQKQKRIPIDASTLKRKIPKTIMLIQTYSV